jgi:ABC-type multidrug transport system ATPase subunit
MELMIGSVHLRYVGADGDPGFELNVPPLRLSVGAVVFVMGHNGSGKSVFLRLLAGEERPTSGAVEVQLGESKWRADDEPAGIVRQKAEDSIACDLTVRENLLLHLKPRNIKEWIYPSRYLNEEVKRILELRATLDSKIDQPARNLSIGQRQTLAFLSVSARRLPILLLDEYLAATDVSASIALRRMAREYATNVPAVVMVVSHDVQVALSDADRILILRSGNLAADIRRGSPEFAAAILVELVSETAKGAPSLPLI